MEQNKSVDFFIRFLKEKHDSFRNNLHELFAVFVGEDKEAKLKVSEKTLSSGKLLKENIASSDVPPWLNTSINILEWYRNNHSTSNDNNYVVQNLIPLFNDINSHQWQFDSIGNVLAFDFDAIYEQCKKESRLNELFDNIIGLLNKIINSGEIDSIKIQTILGKLIATLKNHNTASYFSLYSMWEFLSSLMKNILWEQLEAFPALGPLVKALRKTCEDTNFEFDILRKSIQNKMEDNFSTDFQFLSNKPYALLSDDSEQNDENIFS